MLAYIVILIILMYIVVILFKKLIRVGICVTKNQKCKHKMVDDSIDEGHFKLREIN